MSGFAPLAAAIELQRDVFTEGRRAVETSVELQTSLAQSAADGLETGGRLQREMLGTQYANLRRALTRADEELPVEVVTDEMLQQMDERAAALYRDQEDAVEELAADLEGSAETAEEATVASLDALESQLEEARAALEELEPAEGQPR